MRPALAVLLLAACGGTSIAEFQTQANAAKGCNVTTDRCVNAGSAPCLCPTPVNARLAADIDYLARTVSCGGAVVTTCPPMLNPRCVDEKCVATSK